MLQKGKNFITNSDIQDETCSGFYTAQVGIQSIPKLRQMTINTSKPGLDCVSLFTLATSSKVKLNTLFVQGIPFNGHKFNRVMKHNYSIIKTHLELVIN